MQRYGVVFSSMWEDDDFKVLSMSAKTVYLYLISSPHSNMAGYYKLPSVYAAFDLGIQEQEYKDLLSELEEHGFIYEKNGFVIIKSFLKHNPVKNDKQAKGVWKYVSSLPFSNLTTEFAHNCILYAPSVVQFFSKEMIRYLFDHHVTQNGIDISPKLACMREDYNLLTKNIH